MTSSTPIAILLATYNGEKYLVEQIASLAAQTRRDWTLYVCDDGSTDATVPMLVRLAEADARIVIVDDPIKGRGPGGRFMWLLEQTRQLHQIFFFCDQDDVWHPEKVARLSHVIEHAPARQPLLVHCDLAVVDASLRITEPSYLAGRGIRDPTRQRSTPELALDNTVTGCASAINQALAEQALPMPVPDDGSFIMHDWWLALVASHRGRIVTLPDVLVFYRQHGANTVGAGKALAWRQRLAAAHVADRLSSAASRGRLKLLMVGDPLWRLRAVRERFGGLEKPIRLLGRAHRRDLLEFMVRYCMRLYTPITMLLVASDILRGSGRKA